MARLSFVEQERIARNMTDADILGEYEQEGSVLPPGIQIDKNVLLGEMDGRTYVRDATSAAQAAANMPPGTVADQRVEKFRGNMQGVQQLLAAGPQGMPPQGMSPEGMPPQMGPQMAYGGGIIELANGGGVEDKGWNREDEGALMALGRGAMGLTTGATDWQGLKDQGFLKTAGNVALTGALAIPGIGWAGGAAAKALPFALRGARGLYSLRTPTGIGRALKAGGQSNSAIARGLTRAFGGRFNPNLAIRGSGFRRDTALDRLFGRGQSMIRTGNLAGSRGAPQIIGYGAAGQRALGRAGLGGLMAYGMFGPDAGDMQEEAAAIAEEEGMSPEEAMLKLLEERGLLGNQGGGSSGMGNALEDDLGRAFMNRRDNLLRYEEWLRTGTTEEDELDALLRQRGQDVLDRNDPEFDRNNLLTQLAIGGARAVRDPDTAVESLADTANIITAQGEQQRARREALDDLAFELSAMPVERAAERSRQSVAPQLDAAVADLQQQIASLAGIDMQTRRALESAMMQISAANEFNPAHLPHIENMMRGMIEHGIVPEESGVELLNNFYGLMSDRMKAEAAGYQMGGRNNPLGRVLFNQ